MAAALASVFFVCGCVIDGNNPVENVTKPIGGDRDDHGCLVPAGYSWDADVGACTRSWELGSDQKKAAKIAVAPLSFPVTVVGVDAGGCAGCFLVRLQRNDNQNQIETRLEDWKVAQNEDSDGSMTIEEAIEVAKNSDCAKEGKLTDKYFYNPNSRTWWLDLDTKKEGCAPACVVSEDSNTAEINWRCTGLIEPEQGKDIQSFDECVAAGYPIMKSNPAQCAVPGGKTFTERIVSGDEKSVVDANNKFAFDLYSEYKSEEGNVFFSPYSIETALAMTYEGAKGKTADEMQKVLHFPQDDNARRQGFLSIYNGINEKDKKYLLSTANALWAQKDYPFLQDYFGLTEKYYGGKVTNLDFAAETEKSRQTINLWVEEKTNDKIKDLIPQGAIDAMTRLVLTNAIYFKGNWSIQFDKKDTQEQDFKVSPEKTVKAQMMSMTGEKANFNYYENDDLQALELPYDGKELSMLILLPKGPDLSSLEDSIDPEKLTSLKNSMNERQVDVYLPRFKFETKYFMAGTLKGMGMPTAFSSDADFSGMTGKKDLYISEVIHQAYVEVNEEGTEAAAATGVIMGVTAVLEPPKIPVFRADHPFIFLIQDKSTGNVLFMGRVSDPSK